MTWGGEPEQKSSLLSAPYVYSLQNLGEKKRKGSSVSIKPKSSVSDYVPPKLRELNLPSAFGTGKPKSMSSG